MQRSQSTEVVRNTKSSRKGTRWIPDIEICKSGSSGNDSHWLIGIII